MNINFTAEIQPATPDIIVCGGLLKYCRLMTHDVSKDNLDIAFYDRFISEESPWGIGQLGSAAVGAVTSAANSITLSYVVPPNIKSAVKAFLFYADISAAQPRERMLILNMGAELAAKHPENGSVTFYFN